MKYKLLLINSLLVFFSFSFMFSQEAYWTKIDIPPASSIGSFSLVNENMFLSNYRGIMKSDDLGESWKQLENTYYTHVVSPGNGVLVMQKMYNQCNVSIDGGATFKLCGGTSLYSKINSIKKIEANKFLFTNNEGVYILDYDLCEVTATLLPNFSFISAFQNSHKDILAFTKDKIFILKKDSETYSELSVPYFEAYSVTADKEVLNIFVVSNRGLLKSIDFGNSWITLNSELNKKYKLFYSGDKLVLIDNNWKSDKAEILVSNDNGQTFLKKSISAEYIFQAEVDSSNVLLETEKGLLFSSDFGNSWKNISYNINYNSNSIVADRSGVLRIITNKGVNSSMDFGKTWSFKSNSKFSFSGDVDRCELNNKGDFVMSASSLLFLSSFNEDICKQIYSPITAVNESLNQFFYINDIGQIIYQTHYYYYEGGWENPTHEYWGSFIRKTNDLASTWLDSYQSDGRNFYLQKVIQSKNGKNLMLLNNGTLLYANPDANKWNYLEYSPNLTNNLSSIAINKQGHLFVLENTGKIYSSDDDGVTWRKLTAEMPSGYYLNDLKVSDKNELFFNLNQKVLYSYNNGDTLYDITTGLTSDVERLYLFGDNDAYAVCKDGVYRLHNSITSNLPLKISLQSPANNSQIPSGVKGSTVTCIWDSAINADYYELIVGDSLFQKVSCFFTKIKDNFLAFSVNEKTNYWKVRAVNNFGKGEWSDTRCFRIGTLMNAENKTLPTETTLSQNYPNPFNPSTTISYSMSDDANVSIEIFNTLGSKVKTLVNEKISKGSHEIVWNGMDEFSKIVSTGIYYCTMRAGNFMKTIKLNFLK